MALPQTRKSARRGEARVGEVKERGVREQKWGKGCYVSFGVDASKN